MELDLAIAYLENVIETDKTYQHYKENVLLAENYLKLFTGKNIDTLLKQFALRESHDMFEQRKRLYKSVMPAVANNLEKVFKKGLRATGVYASTFLMGEGKSETKLKDVRQKAEDFYRQDNEKGVEAWLNTTWLNLAIVDPNAFVVVDFASFDETQETASPFPVEFYSAEVIDFKYIRNELEYFIGRKQINMKVKNSKTKTGWQYFMFIDNEVIIYTQIDFNDSAEDLTDRTVRTLKRNLKFIVEINEHKTGKVPAKRLGVKYDLNTKSQTCLSILDPAVPFFEKELKSGSELDITMALHAFPQKIALGRLCPGDPDKNLTCRNGYTSMDTVCTRCKGTGIAPIHTTGQDVLLIPPPSRPDEKFPDLSGYITYITPSIELIKFQDEYVDGLTEKARKAVFGGTTMMQKESTTTATEADYAMDDTYDSLFDFLNKYSAMWLFIHEMIARQVDANEDVDFYHKFPNDLKMKNAAQLYNERKAAKDAGSPDFILNFIDEDILEQQYRDDQDTLNKIKTQNSFIPFKGKDQTMVMSAISRGLVSEETEILYMYADVIFKNIENSDTGNSFYLDDPKKQKARIDEEVAKIKGQLSNKLDTTSEDFVDA